MNSPAPSSPTFWQRVWARRKVIAAAIGAGLALACPLMPPQAQVACRAAKVAVQILSQLDDGSSSSSLDPNGSGTRGLELEPTPEPSSASCSPGTTRSLPDFCWCADDSTWRDYFNHDAGCGGAAGGGP